MEECGTELAEVLVCAGADLEACADIGPDLVAREDGPAWTPLAYVQREPTDMLCTYPFGPSRSMRAAHARRMAKHAEMVLFLQECGDSTVKEAEYKEK